MDPEKKLKKNKIVEGKIISAALDTIEKHTISGTRMHLIADEAEMLQSNLHYYFKTKSDLMMAVLKRVRERSLEIREEIKKETEDTLESALDQFIGQKKEFILREKKYDYAEIDFWVQSRLGDSTSQELAHSFREWREEIRSMLRKYVPALSEEMLEYLPVHFVSMLEGATLQYLADEGVFDLDRYFETGKEILLSQVKSYL